MRSKLQALDLLRWIDTHRDSLRPPVGNKLIWEDRETMAFAVGGPNERTDYHDDPVEEFFYQIEGDMILRLMTEPGQPPEELPIRAGQIFLLPAHVRHSPQRPDPDSIGLVIEPKRPAGVAEAFEWYCLECHQLVHRAEVVVRKIDEDLPPIFERFYRDESARRCPSCGHLHPGKHARSGAASPSNQRS